MEKEKKKKKKGSESFINYKRKKNRPFEKSRFHKEQRKEPEAAVSAVSRSYLQNREAEYAEHLKARKAQEAAVNAASCSYLQQRESESAENLKARKAQEAAVSAVSCSLDLQKMEAEYAEYLKARYFSGKDIFGGEIFETTTNIDGQTIRSSRICPLKSFADPVAYLKEVAEIKNKSPAETRNTAGSSRPQPEELSADERAKFRSAMKRIRSK